MGYQVIKQPNGKLAVFSTGVDAWILYDGSSEEIVKYFVEKAADSARRSAQETVDAVMDDRAREIYCQFVLSFEEADRLSGEHSGFVIPVTSEQ